MIRVVSLPEIEASHNLENEVYEEGACSQEIERLFVDLGGLFATQSVHKSALEHFMTDLSVFFDLGSVE